MARAGVAGLRVTRVRRVRFLYLSQDLIVKSFLLIGAALAAASVSFSAVAGPDFYIIEKGAMPSARCSVRKPRRQRRPPRPCRLRKPRRQRSRP